jgi:thiol-disulfide isomerase/thioredoxin
MSIKKFLNGSLRIGRTLIPWKIKTIFFVGFGCFLFFIGGCAHPVARNTPTPVAWLTDFEQARQTSRGKNLPILAAFVGSDWCPWCQKMEVEIFSQKEFIAYAKDHLVLFQADFPRHKAQPPELKNQNEALAKTYAISRFPTVLIIDPHGKETARTGFRYGGANSYLEYLKELVKDNGLIPKHKDPFPVSISP